ncbi:MAG: hypothetical protein CO158_02605 [Piscirickettsiaceae bacterium CG_4_9_14_3_um_filter_43_564]|nr:hypothetical protein [Thiomicrospira sp.]OIP95283.1 MAG: hypothetical protein AUK56_06350 [Thiomicrospira sp. CG2_30_44_34]PIQ02988.1 MAG: hypothetical protein COW74_08845 [Piscirickettsiaceae bacterium CG18_big_fil_WC_8_21_14_2_50_44_103]PIU38524.1 MAG: hypothetical protein COT01_06470 [Piscirickettsiaceae bacterium CG07_land_8_20_14_0_80_44_28]PIW57361.1 MAG: hypothetical protein COW14_06400 [Piscirickettsiaceae bacterium CG12_big_fil_rev_8_21_14_0_65_44_934]PIW77485.1 MAG: hypothetical p
MTMHYQQHAQQVVSRFERMLSKEQVEGITQEHFDELEILITAALGVVYADVSHQAAKSLELLAKSLRRQAGEVD